MTDPDLFGEEHEPPQPAGFRGYAAHPGTGPEGETCGTCLSFRRIQYHDKTYFKCDLLREIWTHGPGTDVKFRSPACRLWKEEEVGDA